MSSEPPARKFKHEGQTYLTVKKQCLYEGLPIDHVLGLLSHARANAVRDAMAMQLSEAQLVVYGAQFVMYCGSSFLASSVRRSLPLSWNSEPEEKINAVVLAVIEANAPEAVVLHLICHKKWAEIEQRCAAALNASLLDRAEDVDEEVDHIVWNGKRK